MSQQPTSHLCNKGNSLRDLRTLLLDFENTWYIIREVFLVHFFYDMLGKSISPTGWSVQCQLMCLIHAGFRDGVATAVKRLICLKIKCSRKITLRAQTSQSKIWKSCQLRPELYPERISWTHRRRGSHSCCGGHKLGHEPLPPWLQHPQGCPGMELSQSWTGWWDEPWASREAP